MIRQMNKAGYCTWLFDQTIDEKKQTGINKKISLSAKQNIQP
ncbi:hypothetical protein [Ileibacterium valens]